MRIVSMAITSYQHLTTEAIAWLEDAAQEVADGKACHHVSRTAFGWIAYCDEENAGGTIPAEVFATMQAARARGAEYVMMDESGDAEPESIELPPFPFPQAREHAEPVPHLIGPAVPSLPTVHEIMTRAGVDHDLAGGIAQRLRYGAKARLALRAFVEACGGDPPDFLIEEYEEAEKALSVEFPDDGLNYEAFPEVVEVLRKLLQNGGTHDDGTFVIELRGEGDLIGEAESAIAKAEGRANAR